MAVDSGKKKAPPHAEVSSTPDPPGFTSVNKGILSRLSKDRVALAALLIILAYLFTALGGEVYSVYCQHQDQIPIYEKSDIDAKYQAPSTQHWLGTDYRGRDVFWRALHGTRTAVKIGIIASFLAAGIGVVLGTISGYYGGWVDDLVVWAYSVFAAMPTLLFVLAFALLVNKGFLLPSVANAFRQFARLLNTDPGMMAIYLGIGLTGWVSLCRVVRAETMRLRNLAYIQAARTIGLSSFRIMTRHIFPNLFHLVIIYFTIRFAYAIMTEVIVSYLGLGVQLEPSWGVMIADGQQRLWRGVWWEVGGATAFMFFLVLSLHLLGDALRDFLDPRLQA